MSAFGGSLSTLYPGDRLLAVHLGLHSETVLNYWFPTYDADPAMSRYSPGMVLLLQEAGEHGIAQYNFGRGPERYKASFRMGAFRVSERVIAQHRLKRAVRHGVFTLRELTSSSSAARPAGMEKLRQCGKMLPRIQDVVGRPATGMTAVPETGDERFLQHRLCDRRDVPAVAVVTANPLIRFFVTGDPHRCGIPLEFRASIAYCNIAQQDCFGQRSTVRKSVTRLFAAQAAVNPAMIVIDAFNSFNLCMRIKPRCTDMRKHHAALFANEQ